MDHVPGNLGAVLDNLEADHEFLLAGDVFTHDTLTLFQLRPLGRIAFGMSMTVLEKFGKDCTPTVSRDTLLPRATCNDS